MVRTLSELKALFASRDIPTEQAFVDLIDTLSGILPADDTVTPAMLQEGANKTLLRTNASGDVEWANSDLDLLKDSFVCEDTTNTDDYELDLDPLPATYAELHNKPIFLRVTNANTGAVTIAIKDDANLKALETVEKQACPAGLLKANQMFLCAYYQPDDKFYILAILGDTEPIGPAGGSLAGTYPNPTIAPLAVDTAELADDAVDGDKLADATVTKAHMAPAGGAERSVLALDASLDLIWEPRLAKVTRITQTNHGFAVGDVVYRNGSVFSIAQADDAATSNNLAVVSAVVDVHNFDLCVGGIVDIGTSRYNALKAGEWYYLRDDSAGYIHENPPANYIRPVFKGMADATGLVFVSPELGKDPVPDTGLGLTVVSTPGNYSIQGLGAEEPVFAYLKGGAGVSGQSFTGQGGEGSGGAGGTGGAGSAIVKAGPTGKISLTVGAGGAVADEDGGSTSMAVDADGVPGYDPGTRYLSAVATGGAQGSDAYPRDNDHNWVYNSGANGADGTFTATDPVQEDSGILPTFGYGSRHPHPVPNTDYLAGVGGAVMLFLPKTASVVSV